MGEHRLGQSFERRPFVRCWVACLVPDVGLVLQSRTVVHVTGEAEVCYLADTRF